MSKVTVKIKGCEVTEMYWGSNKVIAAAVANKYSRIGKAVIIKIERV
jgi:hypothetical protein